MSNFEFQPERASSKEQYIQMLWDGLVGVNKNMTHEQYLYDIEDHLIYQGPGFVVYKWYGVEFFISPDMDTDGEYAFYLDEIEEVKIMVDESGEVLVSWDKDCEWPTLMDYIAKDGYPIQFKLFKDYGKQ